MTRQSLVTLAKKVWSLGWDIPILYEYSWCIHIVFTLSPLTVQIPTFEFLAICTKFDINSDNNKTITGIKSMCLYFMCLRSCFILSLYNYIYLYYESNAIFNDIIFEKQIASGICFHMIDTFEMTIDACFLPMKSLITELSPRKGLLQRNRAYMYISCTIHLYSMMFSRVSNSLVN